LARSQNTKIGPKDKPLKEELTVVDAFLRLKHWAFFFRPAGLGHEKALLYPASDLLMCSQTHSVQTFLAVPYLLLLHLEKWPRKLNQRERGYPS